MKIKGSVLGTASTGHLHREELPYGILLHRLFLSQQISRIQNRVMSLYESELTVTLSGTTVKGCKLQDTSGSETPGSATPCGFVGTLTATTGGLRCLPKPGAGCCGAQGTGWTRGLCCVAAPVPAARQEWQGRERGNLQESFFWGQKPVIQQMQSFFCSDVFFLLQGQQVEAVHLEDHILAIFLPWAEKGLEATSSSFPAADPATLLAGLEQWYLSLIFS